MARRKQARNITEAVSKGIKQMDTEDTVGLIAGLVGAAVFFSFAEITVAGVDVASSTGHALFGVDVTWALLLAAGGAVFQLVTNQLRQDDFGLDAMQKWGTVFALAPTVLVFWNTNFANWVQGSLAAGGIMVVVAGAGYVLLAAAPQVAMRG